ncbi:MAG: hypothetical protein IIT32_03560 [Bacteroidales bacterium]|nr:hypothetical protein [Bacteroidales bacterium]
MLQRKIEQALWDWKKAATAHTNGSPKKAESWAMVRSVKFKIAKNRLDTTANHKCRS